MRDNEIRAIIRQMAEMPCPNTYERHRDRDLCPCEGTGGRFPWLRDTCPRCHGCDAVKPDPFGTGTVRCDLCDGMGWVPVYNIRLEHAMAALTGEHILRVMDRWRDRLPPAVGATAEDIRLAFWQAVEKVVSG